MNSKVPTNIYIVSFFLVKNKCNNVQLFVAGALSLRKIFLDLISVGEVKNNNITKIEINKIEEASYQHLQCGIKTKGK